MRLSISLFIVTVIAGMMFTSFASMAVQMSEKNMYLGVLNGQIQGNSIVKANRTLSDSVLFKADRISTLPAQLIIRNAEARSASGNDVYVTIKQSLPENGKEALITVRMALMIDGVRKGLSYTNTGNNVFINLPDVSETVELKTEYPVELQVPANYRGNLQVVMDIEGVSRD
ncbi:fimbrial protein [Escherichia coli]|nr:fimbrial protein [Escherichia coli]EER1954259.1 fimbrial protein [Escherichia coli]EES3420441.1 fimbrial protein [Escherichia coli]EES9724469.1 fimbrial protein [Escherichia coli]EET4486300.1 fimbrial protein [Escherichia coli]